MKEKNKFGWIGTIAGIFICMILIPIIVMNVTIIVKSYINPDEVPDFFGYKPLIVLTGSMEPEFFGGDLAIVRETEPGTLKAGDVISYSMPTGSIVTHRISRLTENDKGEPVFYTKGDANDKEDEAPTTYKQVEGIYLFSIPKIGHMALFLHTPVGVFLIIGIPLGGFIIWDKVRRQRKDRKKIKQLQFQLEERHEQDV